MGEEKAVIMKSKLAENTKGEKNGNFNHKWSDEKKEDHSAKLKEYNRGLSDEERKAIYGKSNRGLIRSKEFLENWHSTQKIPGYKRPPKSEETKIKIGIKSREKAFSQEFQIKLRKKMEENGRWIPLIKQDFYKLYGRLSNWNERMWDIMPNQNIIKEFGVFNIKTNTRGLVRDHLYNRKSGFDNGVFPIILRHPENCNIISHSENVKKFQENWITLEELFDKIRNSSGKNKSVVF